jgi:hypothetical protein
MNYQSVYLRTCNSETRLGRNSSVSPFRLSVSVFLISFVLKQVLLSFVLKKMFLLKDCYSSFLCKSIYSANILVSVLTVVQTCMKYN